MKKFLSVIGNILLTIVVIFAVVLTVVVIASTRNANRIPSLFGYSFLSVLSDSMEGKDGFYTGDLIIDRTITDGFAEANDLKVGDVITFIRDLGDGSGEFIETHRIVKDPYSNPNEIIDGIWHRGNTNYYVTQGDHEIAIDMKLNGDTDYVSPGAIIGIWTGIRIPKLGAAMEFLRSPTGFMICVVIPIALFFIYELYVFIMTLTRRQKEKTLQEVADKEAELKAKAVAEFLAQQTNDSGTVPPAEDTKPAEPAPETAPSETENPAEPDTADISEAEKQRIIQEYLAKQKPSDEG